MNQTNHTHIKLYLTLAKLHKFSEHQYYVCKTLTMISTTCFPYITGLLRRSHVTKFVKTVENLKNALMI